MMGEVMGIELNFEDKKHERQCTTCSTTKSISSFYGRSKKCIPCYNAAARERYAHNGGKEKALERYHNNPEKTKERALKYYNEHREEYNQARRKRRSDQQTRESGADNA